MARRPKIDPRTPKTIHVRVGNPVRVNKGDRSAGYVPKYTEFPFIRIDNQVRVDFDHVSLEALADTFTDLFKQYGETYSDLRIDAVRGECGCYYSDCGCGLEHYLVGSRLETEDEIDVRIELDRETGLLYYDTPNGTPMTLQKIIKNRWGPYGIVVSPSYIKRLLDNVEMNELHGMIGEYHIGPLPSFEDLHNLG